MPGYIDDFMVKAYGSTLLLSDGGEHSSPWCQRWDAAVRLNGKQYALPGASVGRHFVDALSAELNYFALGQYPAERCLMFSSVVLHKDRMIKKGNDIHHLLEKWVKLWQEEKFDFLIQEAVRCYHSVRFTKHKLQDHADHIVKLFSKLMLEVIFVLLSMWSLSMLAEVFGP